MAIKMIYFLFLVILFFSFSCKDCNSNIVQNKPDEKRPVNYYLHLSHTRTGSNAKMDSVAASLEYSAFDMLWLGGDLMYLTSQDHATMEYVDNIFDLGNKNTLLTLGNHDYSNLDLVELVTKRPNFYSYSKDLITFLILDTQDSCSSATAEQLQMIRGVTDTIKHSKYLVILHHKLVWMRDNSGLEQLADSISNGYLGTCSYCINENNFYSDVYPMLLEVKNKGIEVLCIAGDIGMKVSQFEYQTNEGIFFLASGISAGDSTNKALVFEHDLSNQTLNWQYKLLTEL